MPHKLMKVYRAAGRQAGAARPVMLGIAGDSAAGKTTLSTGLAEALGPDRSTSVCVDDYHRYDREERKGLPFTALHPDCNYVAIMEQHLQHLATGQPILKPVYDHATGTLGRPELVEPREFVIVEGLLPLHTKLARACFDITVYLEPAGGDPPAVEDRAGHPQARPYRGRRAGRAGAPRAGSGGLHPAAAIPRRHRRAVRSDRRPGRPARHAAVR